MKSQIQKNYAPLLFLAILTFAVTSNLQAQFEVNGQLIERAEFRNGYGTLIANDTAPAAFIASRARLQFTYKIKDFVIHTSVQDVRVFGSAPQLKSSDPFLSVYEAWGEIKLDTNWSLKVGRQELSYDNFRFLGNVDWTLQGRTHDFVLLKFERNKFKVHTGGGFNQDNEKLYGNDFNTAAQYKTAQFIRAEYAFGNLSFVLLGWNDGRQYYLKDSIGRITERGIRYMQTVGLPSIKYKICNTTISAFYYHQLGKDAKNKTVNAYDASLQVSQLIKINEEKGRRLTLTAGAEMLSGTEKGKLNDNNSFVPLYGTNHAHNGYMDYFFVGGRHEGSVGLNDFFFRVKFDLNKKIFFALNSHYFTSNVAIKDSEGNNIDQYLGVETDFAFGYKLKEYLSVQSGYSQMFAASSLTTLRNVTNAQDNQCWAYVMLIFRPKSDKQFIGLIF